MRLLEGNLLVLLIRLKIEDSKKRVKRRVVTLRMELQIKEIIVLLMLLMELKRNHLYLNNKENNHHLQKQVVIL